MVQEIKAFRTSSGVMFDTRLEAVRQEAEDKLFAIINNIALAREIIEQAEPIAMALQAYLIELDAQPKGDTANA